MATGIFLTLGLLAMAVLIIVLANFIADGFDVDDDDFNGGF